jgi:hypothetical protein
VPFACLQALPSIALLAVSARPTMLVRQRTRTIAPKPVRYIAAIAKQTQKTPIALSPNGDL